MFQLGEKGSGFRPRAAVQDFSKLKQECLATGTLFEDPEFPADDSSLYFSKRPDRYIEWKRPMVDHFYLSLSRIPYNLRCHVSCIYIS